MVACYSVSKSKKEGGKGKRGVETKNCDLIRTHITRSLADRKIRGGPEMFADFGVGHFSLTHMLFTKAFESPPTK